MKLARTLIFFHDLDRVEPTPAAQKLAAPVPRSGLITNSSRGAQRARIGVRDAVIWGILQEHEDITWGSYWILCISQHELVAVLVNSDEDAIMILVAKITSHNIERSHDFPTRFIST